MSYGPTLPSSGKGFWDDDIGNMEALSDDEVSSFEPPFHRRAHGSALSCTATRRTVTHVGIVT